MVQNEIESEEKREQNLLVHVRFLCSVVIHLFLYFSTLTRIHMWLLVISGRKDLEPCTMVQFMLEAMHYIVLHIQKNNLSVDRMSKLCFGIFDRVAAN